MGNSKPYTVCVLTPEQLQSVLDKTNPELYQEVKRNIADNWVYVILPPGSRLNEHHKIGYKIAIKYTDEGGKVIMSYLPLESAARIFRIS